MRSKKPIRVLICNKYTLLRAGIRALFPQGGDIEVVGEVVTARQAIDFVGRLRPDVVLLDATTPKLTCPEATRRLKALDPHIKVLIVTMGDGDEDATFISGCLRAGAAGYVRKNDGAVKLKSAILHVCRSGANAA